MITKAALFFVLVFAQDGYKDEFYKEKVRENLTPMQCQIELVQQAVPRIWKLYEGYKLKSIGCMTEDQLRDALNRRD